MIELQITMTGKSYAPKAAWQRFDDERRLFGTVDDAKAWLKKHYGNCSRQPMFVDTVDGEAKRVGYVYGFRNADWSHSPVDKWLQQDWVEFRECSPIPI